MSGFNALCNPWIILASCLSSAHSSSEKSGSAFHHLFNCPLSLCICRSIRIVYPYPSGDKHDQLEYNPYIQHLLSLVLKDQLKAWKSGPPNPLCEIVSCILDRISVLSHSTFHPRNTQPSKWFFFLICTH